jgi:hypothetical protein
MQKPANYRIQVKGVLDEKWSGRLSDMRISREASPEQDPLTTLEGCLRDQAALSGVLNTLYELHLMVVSVECLEESQANGEEQARLESN